MRLQALAGPLLVLLRMSIARPTNASAADPPKPQPQSAQQERWNGMYRDGRKAPWDIGRPSLNMRYAILLTCLAITGCQGDFLGYGDDVSTTTPTKEQITYCRSVMYINPGLEIDPLGYCLQPGMDDVIRFKFTAKTDDPSLLFDESQVDASRFSSDFRVSALDPKAAESWWDVSAKTLTGANFTVPPPNSTGTRGLNVGYVKNGDGTLTTKITEGGATLASKPGVFVPHRDRRTKSKKYKELDDDLTYTANQLDRDVVSDGQIRLVIQTFREKLFTDIFPGRTEVPKTLVFAKNDLHADDIVKIIREEFGKGNDFCQKITSKTTGKKPEELLAEFRNSFNPRIAVTVDMIATGTDVKPLECLLFMRNINSAAYFEQMKGRGSRVVDTDTLQGVTPDAKQKTHFVIVDAVGVCERDKTASKPLDRKPYVPLDKILDAVAKGMANADVVSTLAARLSRMEQEISEEQEEEISAQADGKSLATLCHKLLESLDPDQNTAHAVEKFGIPEGQEPTEE